MKADQLRKKFINFFKAEPRNHQEISPAPLVPVDDPTTLFTSSGMQQLVPYLAGEPHPQGRRLVNSQPCLRLEDIDEIGDNRHTTFFEMLGNWSLGDYFKEEQLAWFWQFLTQELQLPKKRLWVSVFAGSKAVPKDNESARIWKKLGVPESRIFYYGVEKNWWSRSGPPDRMPPGEIGGPDSEVFFDFGQRHNPQFGSGCHPNCDCGRFLEIGNSVFIQYKKEKDGTLSELPQKNVDFGGGLERIVAVVNNEADIFKIDLFKPLIENIKQAFSLSYGASPASDRGIRIIADHLRAAVMLISEGVEPANKLQGYVLRRLIRRSVFHAYLFNNKELGGVSLPRLAAGLTQVYPKLKPSFGQIKQVLEEETKKFEKVLIRGLGKIEKAIQAKQKIDGKFAFDLYQTDGFPLDLTIEVLREKGQVLDKGARLVFQKEFERHRQLSRSASEGMFKGGLADTNKGATKLHTATHLLHAALRKVLGNHVRQKGSNITSERLRFDFSHPQKLTESEIRQVERLINQQIKKDLPVTCETKTLKEALTEGALAFFGGKYGEKVKVYTIGSPGGEWFSKEVCGGPHVTSTGKIGRVRIVKQEKIGAATVRLYAQAETA